MFILVGGYTKDGNTIFVEKKCEVLQKIKLTSLYLLLSMKFPCHSCENSVDGWNIIFTGGFKKNMQVMYPLKSTTSLTKLVHCRLHEQRHKQTVKSHLKIRYNARKWEILNFSI